MTINNAGTVALKSQGYCWLENVRDHFVENSQLESLSPI